MWTELNGTTSEELQRIENEPAAKPFQAYDPAPALRRIRRDKMVKIVLFATTLIALWFVGTNVPKYLTVTRETYGLFWPRHQWLFVHVLAGTIAVVFGPVQFWLGTKRDQPTLHRAIGVTYVACTGLGAVTAVYLAFHTVYGWIFGAGLTAMALAWVVTTGMATLAICRRMVSLHREWMIRSYVVTFGFVLFRVISEGLDMANVGTLPERLTFSSWACWTFPLLLAEGVMQARKVFMPAKGQTSNLV